MLQVQLDQFSTSSLSGLEGESRLVETSPRNFIEGKFRLQIIPGTQQSEIIVIAPNTAFVEKKNNQLFITELTGNSEDFTAVFLSHLNIQATPASPWCRAQTARLIKKHNEPVVVLLSSAQFSLDPSKPYVPSIQGRLYLTGNKQTDVTGTNVPGTAITGFYIRYDQYGLYVDGGSPAGSGVVLLSDFGNKVTISAKRCLVIFEWKRNNDRPESSFQILSPVNDIEISLRGTGLALEKFTALGARFSINSKSCKASAGWLTVDGFTGKKRKEETFLALSTEQDPGAGNKTRLFTSTERLQFNYPLPDETGSINNAPQFVYTDSSLKSSLKSAITNRRALYYGLQVENIFSSKCSGQAKLDATVATFDYDRTQKKFQLRAGIADVKVKGQPQPSLLLPKSKLSSGGLREIEIPAGELQLKGRYNYNVTDVVESPLKLDTSKQTTGDYFIINQPFTEAPPLGIPSYNKNVVQAEDADSATFEYSKWHMKRTDNAPQRFKVDGQGKLVPEEGNAWISNYRTSDQKLHHFLPYPGSGIQYDPITGITEKSISSFSKLDVVVDTTGKEFIVYTAFCAAITYLWMSRDENEAKIIVNVDNIVDEDWIKEKEAGKLYFVYNKDSERNRQRFKDFIEDQRKSSTTSHIVLGVAKGLMGFVLWRKTADGEEYCFDNHNSRIIVDYQEERSFKADDLGWTEQQLKRYQNESPELWPGLDSKSGKKDPTNKDWRGFIFAELPFTLTLNADALDWVRQFPILTELYNFINQETKVFYGWMDEKAATLSAGFENEEGYSIIPAIFKRVIDIKIKKFGVKVKENTHPAGMELKLQITMPLIAGKDGKQLTLEGVGTFSFNNTKPGKITIYPPAGQDQIQSPFPGFSSILIEKFETDFTGAQLFFKATPEENLAAAVPFFDPSKPVEAVISIDLKSASKSVTAQFTLDSEKNTSFGKFPVTIVSIILKFDFESETSNKFSTTLAIRCKFNILGQVIAGWLTFDRTGLRVQLDEVSIDLEFGEVFKLSGSLNWSDDRMDAIQKLDFGPGYRDKIKQSNFFGALSLESSVLKELGKNNFYFKIGSRNNQSYYIGAFSNEMQIKLGIANLNKPAILFARNADFDGNLATLATDPGKEIFNAIRPPVGIEAAKTWLKKWNTSNGLGNTFAASGFIDFEKVPLTDAPEQKEQNLTSIYLSTGGIFRVDAVVKLMGKEMGFALAIDRINKRMAIGVRFPEINFSSEQNPQITLNPGTIYISWSYGGEFYFLVSAAYPEYNPGKPLQRKWENAFRATIHDLKPPLPNTAWAGFKFSIEKGNVLFAYACKIGYTKKGNFSVVKYEFEISIGYVAVFNLTEGNTSQLLNAKRISKFTSVAKAKTYDRFVFDEAALDELDALLNEIRIAEISLKRSMKDDLCFEMDAECFGYIKGSATAEIFGVTVIGADLEVFAILKMCGSTCKGITYIGGLFTFSLTVKILCVKHTAYFDFELTLVKKGDKPCIENKFLNSLTI